MIQFTQKEIEHLRKKKNECPQAILRLEEEVKDILKEPLLIPKMCIRDRWSTVQWRSERLIGRE